jgi:hypothetical protein
MNKNKYILYVISAFIFSYGVFTSYLAYQSHEFALILWSLLSFITFVGLVLVKPWVKYFVYSLSFLIVLGWAGYTGFMVYNGWPYVGLYNNVKALVPSALLLSFCTFIAYYVHSYFNQA